MIKSIMDKYPEIGEFRNKFGSSLLELGCKTIDLDVWEFLVEKYSAKVFDKTANLRLVSLPFWKDPFSVPLALLHSYTWSSMSVAMNWATSFRGERQCPW